MSLDFNAIPLREIRKGRELMWDPHAIDFSQDKADWLKLNDDEQRVMISQVLGFLIGERAVTHDLAPLQQVLRRERGHMEEEMYITQQLFEESTHVEFFQRWLDEVLPGTLGVEIPIPPGERSPILHEELPKILNALYDDSSPEAQMRAVVVYHQIVEGVLAEVGYQIFYDCLDPQGIMPGLREGVRNIQTDEARHIAFGTYLARRLIKDYPHLKEVFSKEMDGFFPGIVRTTEILFEHYDDPIPFDLNQESMARLAQDLFDRRKKSVLQGGLVEA